MTTEEQLNEIVKKTKITDLLIRYFVAVDDKCLDLNIVKATYTSDAKIIRPDGKVIQGHDNIFEAHKKSFTRFMVTHHVMANFIIEINMDKAILRGNMTAMHLWNEQKENSIEIQKQFCAGGVLSAKAQQIDNIWRISEFKNNVVGRTGDINDFILYFKRTES